MGPTLRFPYKTANSQPKAKQEAGAHNIRATLRIMLATLQQLAIRTIHRSSRPIKQRHPPSHLRVRVSARRGFSKICKQGRRPQGTATRTAILCYCIDFQYCIVLARLSGWSSGVSHDVWR